MRRLCRKAKLANILQNAPEISARRKAHGSISGDEGEPFRNNRLSRNHVSVLRALFLFVAASPAFRGYGADRPQEHQA
jgi:hypothetical protein